ncbi:tRNA (adenosine(37)-N6)-threonylcarbamoyltransferase complex dimerization subunit type 1 TsaB [Nemorincola caseinilytica]|uniref:tRNA (Adenosine(37)-N6)-threonylcarbamoyltransferase complex dimerization subunit type 1 TsaB n=2 Tax=Nemorincola caseinilytica TaxID=2054315 RepID=A0ABP8N2L4_9BACT
MVCADGKPVCTETNSTLRDHATAINNMISAALASAGIAMAQLAAIAVCSGPGSYTGLRIAMATAKGICYAMDIPLLLQDRLSLLALAAIQQHPTAGYIASILVARDKEYFISIHDNKFDTILAPVHMMEEDMAEMLQNRENLHITTNAAEELFFKLKVKFCSFGQNIILDNGAWAEYAYEQYDRNGNVNIANAIPLYLKSVYTHK